MPERHTIGDRPARPFHQVDARHAAGDRQAVGLGHFGCGQKLVHAARTLAKIATLRPMSAEFKGH